MTLRINQRLFASRQTARVWSSKRSFAIVAFIGLLIAAIAAPATAEPASKPVEDGALVRTGLTFVSTNSSVTITSEFSGGRMNRCDQVSEDEFAITIEPERNRINDSAWYAFRIDSSDTKLVSVSLNYVGGTHRYDPKISRDGTTWESAGNLVARRHPLGSEVELRIELDGKPIWIAGQELIDNDAVDRWTDELVQLPHVTRSLIGESVQGRPLHRLDITESEHPDYVFIITRQHPPEVSGAIGMMHFVESIASDTKLSKKFRDRYSAVVVPMVNPDGVAQGHWRCNANGIDLNRDWSHPSQPETRAVVDQLLACRSGDEQRLCLFIDFHSTFDDVFYTHPSKADLYPRGFTENWLGAIQHRFPSYAVNHDPNHNAHRSTSKAWVARTLGVTAITYEFGDETDRNTIRSIASGAAEEMMRLLVDLPDNRERTERIAAKDSDSQR